MSDFNRERLGKIVAIAKYGEGGEKENATAIVRKICAQYGLDFDTVMQTDIIISEYRMEWKNSREKRLLAQIIGRFALDTMPNKELWENQMRKSFFFKTTKEKFVETLNAWDVLSQLYRKEEKKMQEVLFFGFLEKHQLYATPASGMSGRPITNEELKLRAAGSNIARHLDDANLHKRIGPQSLPPGS